MSCTSQAGVDDASLEVILPTVKRSRDPAEAQISKAIKAGGAIRKISILVEADQHDNKRSLAHCDQLAKWLEQHGPQLEELTLALKEAEEVRLVSSIFQCSELRLTKLLVTAADFPPDLLQKLPATLEVFSGHLGAHGDLTPFVALPKLHSLAVRCFPTERIDGHYTTADIPLALLVHPSLQCLLVDATSSITVIDKKAASNAATSKLKCLAVTGEMSTYVIHDFIDSCPQLEHLCLRTSPLSQMCCLDDEPMVVNVQTLQHLKVLELGFPHLKSSFSGLQFLPHLSAVLLCGQFGRRKPKLPNVLASEPDELTVDLPFGGESIVRRAKLPGSQEKFRITPAMSLRHGNVVLNPTLFKFLSEAVVSAVA